MKCYYYSIRIIHFVGKKPITCHLGLILVFITVQYCCYFRSSFYSIIFVVVYVGAIRTIFVCNNVLNLRSIQHLKILYSIFSLLFIFLVSYLFLI